MTHFQPTYLQGLVVVALYLLPSLIAVSRRTSHLATLILVNVLLGWTVVGWMYSLALAAFSERRGETLGELRLTAPPRKPVLVKERELRRAA